MVEGMPHFDAPSRVCEGCLTGKQNRDSIPRKSNWRATEKLQLIHADLCAYTPQQNGVAEWKNRTVMNLVQCMLYEKKLPKTFWPEAVNWAFYVLNRCPTFAVMNQTPEEAWSGRKPSVEHFRIFGCVAYVHIPEAKRKKLDAKSTTCVLLGVSEESKAYRLYDPVAKKIIISKDVVFEENKYWNWDKSYEEQMVVDLNYGNEEDNKITDAENMAVVSEEEEEVIEPDPMHFKEAVKHDKWRMAMHMEIKAIEKNNTWELTNLPTGAKKIGLKWVYKTKLKENGELDKFKARLVAKRYVQQQGIDYTEVFAPVARMDTVRMIVALAAQKGWNVYQLDVKFAFLHGELKEEVYVEQPRGYELEKYPQKVYKLKKALYGLKQAPRAWFSRIEAHFVSQGFEKCYSEQTLFIKTKEGVKNIMRYLKGTIELGVFYKKGGNEGLVGYTDSNYAGDLNDRKSTSGYVFMLGSGAVAWSSKKQPIVTLSTIEAEFVAGVACASQAIWIKRIFEKLSLEESKCTTIYCDNSSTIRLSKNPVLHGRSKHIDVRFHFLRDLTRDGVVELVFCETKDQLADVMTKPLTVDVFQKFRSQLGVCQVPEIN
ncbi:hypothetical protein KPL71_007611 [Citrus sinensis]|uniref:Uncharacterized protein n=1 Tax=Citrus sinensis TaxID=2711 RepID=A0ACB8M0Z3_CITSI|nr:hypothetical protein KPL71_007611 [Citrus sinensis]